MIVLTERSNNIFGNLTFKNISSKLINKLKYFNFNTNIKIFKLNLKDRMNEIFSIFVNTVSECSPNLNHNFNFYSR